MTSYIRTIWNNIKDFYKKRQSEFLVASLTSFALYLIPWVLGYPVGILRLLRVGLFFGLLTYFIKAPRGQSDCQRIIRTSSYGWSQLKAQVQGEKDPEFDFFVQKQLYEEYDVLTPRAQVALFWYKHQPYATEQSIFTLFIVVSANILPHIVPLTPEYAPWVSFLFFLGGFFIILVFVLKILSWIFSVIFRYKALAKASYFYKHNMSPSPDNIPPGWLEQMKTLIQDKALFKGGWKGFKPPSIPSIGGVLKSPGTIGTIATVLAAANIGIGWRTYKMLERHRRENMEFWEKFVANAERHELKSMEFWRKFIADAERYQPENTESWQKFKADAERHHRENMEFHQKFVADAERHQPENTESWQKFKADAERHHRENMEFWKKFVADVNLDKTNTELRELAKEKLELEVDKNKQWFSTDKSPYDNLIKSLEARELELNQLKTIQIQKAESFQTPKPSSLLDDFPDEI